MGKIIQEHPGLARRTDPSSQCTRMYENVKMLLFPTSIYLCQEPISSSLVGKKATLAF